MEQLTHWKKETNPNYLGSWDLITGCDDNGIPTYGQMTLTIVKVEQEKVADMEQVKKGNGKATKDEIVIHFKENVKPFILHAKCNFKAIESATRTPFIEKWVGKKIIIYVEKNVKAFGTTTDALRIRPYAPTETKLSFKCSDCGKEITASNGLTPEQLHTFTLRKYNRSLCAECATKEKARLQALKEQEAQAQAQETQTTNEQINEQPVNEGGEE